MSKKTEKKTRTIGDVINQLSAQPVPITVKVGKDKFDLFVHPASEEDLRSYSEIAGDRDQASIRNAMDHLISACIRDSDGNRVWSNPADIKVMGYVRIDLQAAINEHVFGISLSEFSAKN